ncbi:D-lactate dehydrogenase [Thioclava sp. SK-1]|uniref:D-lactate dehydrogenase n=1 Tax=Thioclava sp. SK-1 TaxID=1889770 RepID=UPI000824C1C6|nr:D-lactate dehydrogenase [Thioclava sp. SK-1]OCX58160.1 D-lactate dehydrogenase [Thioclava sp. SK-1]
MTGNDDLIGQLRSIVGRRHVLTEPRATERFRRGYRSGEGAALAVVQPGSLLEQWQVLQACVRADKIIIMQAANTGLTEGSTPKGSYDRDVVIVSTSRLTRIHLLDGGRQVVALPGATLFGLEKALDPKGRDPHSVIGSSCIGASVVGGVCNNSGGALVERGPSYTELALFAQLGADGVLRLVNHLGLALGDTPEQILTRVQAGEFSVDEAGNRQASDHGYGARVRDVDAPTPARFNADKGRLYEASGCAGKLAVFAVRLDTFSQPDRSKTFYIGTNSTEVLTRLRRKILSQFNTLPVSAEYMHREAFDITHRYGKDTVLAIDKLGTARLPRFFAIKGALDARLNRWSLTRGLTDRVLQGVATLWPEILPKRLLDYRNRYEHHLILKMRDGGIDEAVATLPELFAQEDADFFECDARETKIAGLHRFAAAGAAVRYMALNREAVEDILPLDLALRRNDRDWFETLPPDIDAAISHKMYYGHFMCHVLHQDYIVKRGHDGAALKAKMLKLLDARGVEYPAEHNVGHLYVAKPDLAQFYRECDPTNSFNPGLGKQSRCKH